MTHILFFATLALSLVSTTSVRAEKWDKDNDPRLFNPILSKKVVFSFDELPLEAKIKDSRLGWSETFWPSNLGGIAFRWNHPDPRPFEYDLHTKKELLKMTQEELATLSPAELYDIANNDYKYTLTKKVLKSFSSKDLWWEGICHGWSLAAIHYPEPAPVTITNKDGIKVHFGSSDVKGLLSMHDAFNSKGFYVRVGKRCSVKGKVPGEDREEDAIRYFPDSIDANRPECRDVNAGAFHVILTSLIGINSQGFVADVDRFNDVWNQPVVSYKSEVLGSVELNLSDIENNVAQKVQVKTTMVYGDELDFRPLEVRPDEIGPYVSKLPVTSTESQAFASKSYEYILEIDRDGKIIGGEWVSLSRPDMLWMKKKDESFRNSRRFKLSGLNKIYRPVTLDTPLPDVSEDLE